jgi:hypothetical protein
MASGKSPRRVWVVAAVLGVVGVALMALAAQAAVARGDGWWPVVLGPLGTAALAGLLVWLYGRQQPQPDGAKRQAWMIIAALFLVGFALMAVSLVLVLA